MTPYLIHVGYLLMLFALAARDMLWLRATLACAQVALAVFGWSTGVRSMAIWNLVFVSINLAWIARIVHERRAVELPADLVSIYEQGFSALSRREFLRWWRQGRREWIRDTRIMWNGRHPEALFYLLAGTARVTRHGNFVCDLLPGQLVGEMSLITGEPANADVSTIGESEVIWWPMADLLAIRDEHPALWARFQSVIGRDLVDKIVRGDAFNRIDR